REHFVQLSLFEEALLKDKESELDNLKQRIRDLQVAVEEGKSALVDLATRTAHARSDLAAQEKDRAGLAAELARNRSEDSAAAAALHTWREKLNHKLATAKSAVERAGDVAQKIREVAESIRSCNTARDDQEKRIELLRGKVQETGSRLSSLQALQRNYEGYQD